MMSASFIRVSKYSMTFQIRFSCMINAKHLHLFVLFAAVGGLSILFLLLINNPAKIRTMASSSNSENDRILKSVDFEVFGRVQGVFFRKYTKLAAERLKLVGWCRNTENDTVEGRIQGSSQNVDEMKRWLQTVGSPKSRIERAEFKNEKTIDECEYKSFGVKH